MADIAEVPTEDLLETAPVEEELDTPPPDEAKDVPEGDLLSDDEGTHREGVPDQYTFEAPEGLEITPEDQAGLDQFSEAAREMGLTQAQYQALVEYDLNRSQSADEMAVDAWNTRVSGWKQSVLSDKEIGGDALPETKKLAQAALKQFGDSELTKLLKSPSVDNPDGLALNNHPAVLRMLSRIGKVLADPTLLEGDDKAEPQLRPEDRMYPTMRSK
jgi:hypothetical protein